MSPSPEPKGRIQLPRSSTRGQRGYAHLKLLSRVVPAAPYATGFEGRIFRPGAVVDAEELGTNPVVLECAGPIGTGRGHNRRPLVWILWQYQSAAWRELARASSVSWEWALALREPAIRALYPRPEFVDVLALGKDLAEEIMEGIDRKLEHQIEGVKVNESE